MKVVPVVLTVALPLLAGEGSVVKTQGFLPFADAPIHYRTSVGLADPSLFCKTGSNGENRSSTMSRNMGICGRS
jgi:hypothetical protein